MSTSQNGWPVISSSDLAPVVVRGVAMAPGVRKDVAPLFQDLVNHLADIEAPHDGWCWGYAYRPVRGQTAGFSNHASGTAIDYNAPVHNRQSVDRYQGYSTAQVAAIHALLARYSGVIRWGGDYHDAPYDPMHFEVVGTYAAVSAVIARITARPKPKPTPLALIEDDMVYQRYESTAGVKSKFPGEFVVTVYGGAHLKNPDHRDALIAEGRVSRDVKLMDESKVINVFEGQVVTA